MFHGSIVALVTPFRNGVIDERAFQRLVVERAIAERRHERDNEHGTCCLPGDYASVSSV